MHNLQASQQTSRDGFLDLGVGYVDKLGITSYSNKSFWSELGLH